MYMVIRSLLWMKSSLQFPSARYYEILLLTLLLLSFHLTLCSVRNQLKRIEQVGGSREKRCLHEDFCTKWSPLVSWTRLASSSLCPCLLSGSNTGMITRKVEDFEKHDECYSKCCAISMAANTTTYRFVNPSFQISNNPSWNHPNFSRAYQSLQSSQ